MIDLADLERTGNRYADQYVVSAQRLGLATELLGRHTAVISGKGLRMTVNAAILGCNNAIATRVASNKLVCGMRLRQAGYRVPDAAGFSTYDRFDADDLLHQVMAFAAQRFPVVLKPVRGHGGLNVYAGVAGGDHLSWVVNRYVDLAIGDFLVEKHVDGRQYRLNLFDGELVSARERFLPSITGDGRGTIRALIEAANAERDARGAPRLTDGERMGRFLARQGLDLDSVPAAGREIGLGAEGNLLMGGRSRRLPIESVPRMLVDRLAGAARCCGLRWVGVDLIVDDLFSPGAHERGYINELNSAPAPAEFRPERTLDEYLDPATRVLRAYFDLP